MATPHDYVELRTRSAFSFLEGCSNPEDLVQAAADSTDTRPSPWPIAMASPAAPRFHARARARASGRRAQRASPVGAEGSRAEGGGIPRWRPDRVLLLVESPEGWRRLCRLITLAHSRRDKALEARDVRARQLGSGSSWEELEAEAGHWSVLLRGDERLQPALLDRAHRAFGERLSVDVSHLLDRRIERIGRRAADMAESRGVPVVATGTCAARAPRIGGCSMR